MLLQLKELEEAKENTQRLLAESLDTLASLRAGGGGMVMGGDRDREALGGSDAAKTAVKTKAKKVKVKSAAIDPADDASTPIKDLKLYQVSSIALSCTRTKVHLMTNLPI